MITDVKRGFEAKSGLSPLPGYDFFFVILRSLRRTISYCGARTENSSRRCQEILNDMLFEQMLRCAGGQHATFG
jgi:hypothetical protein